MSNNKILKLSDIDHNTKMVFFSQKKDSWATDRFIILLTNNNYNKIEAEKELFELVDNYKDNIKFDEIYNDKTILNLAISKYPKIAIKIISEYDINSSFKIGNEVKNALFTACQQGSYKLVCALIKKFGTKCYPEIKTLKDGTVLIAACQNDSYKIVSKLIDSFGEKCNPGASNLSGMNGNEKIAMLLLDKFGSECNVKKEGCISSRTALKWCDGSIFGYKPFDFDMRKVAFKILNNYYTYKDGTKIEVFDIETALNAYEKTIKDKSHINPRKINSIVNILKRIVLCLTLDYHLESKYDPDLDISKFDSLVFNDGGKIYSTNKYGNKQSVWLIEHLVEVFKIAIMKNDNKIKGTIKEFIIRFVNSNE